VREKPWCKRLHEIANLEANELTLLCIALGLPWFDGAGFGRRSVCGKSKQGGNDSFVRHDGNPLHNKSTTALGRSCSGQKICRGIRSPKTC